MGASQQFNSLSYELRIKRAKNIEFKSTGLLFVRCYLSAGKNNRVRLDSQEISPQSDLAWNKSFSLECSGSLDSMDMLMQGTVVFELRGRSTVRVLGKTGGSKLLGRAEIPWKTVSDSPEMEIEKWIIMVPKSRRVQEDVKPPAVQVSMKVQIPAVTKAVPGVRRRRRTTNWDDCGCAGVGCNCSDYDMYAVAAALEAF